MKEYVLVVDDEQSLRQVLALFFKKEGFEVDTASSLAEAEKAIEANAYDLVLTDLRMAKADDGLNVLRAAVRKNPWTQVVVLTAYGTVETAKEALKLGAYDYLTKPFENAELRKIVHAALARKEDDDGRRKALRESVRGTSSYEGIVGRSETMLRIFELIERVAPTDANVMILGESGTGKELVAAALHARSHRKEHPFVPINCAAIPETLIESELFGHARGAFTGAVQTKKGLFESAHRGTLFLDEVGELPLPMQSKLLRALQERTFRRVGGNEDLAVDFRLICASRRDLNREMAEGRFRDDLFFRLNVIQIFVPPLRERREDIPALAAHFAEKFAGKHGKPVSRIDGEAMRALLAHDFPGNVRELENILERATIIETKNVISVESLPPNMTKIVTSGPAQDGFLPQSMPEEGAFLDTEMDRLEKSYLLKALELSGGNRTEAAKLLNISFRSLRYRLQKHGIE
ncbi:MAG: two component system response regulator, sigma54-specific [Deltaproteobacteria bacterium]|nr:two component system response regulator, sigma54-specific [Deltaproteobacteria bacterium]